MNISLEVSDLLKYVKDISHRCQLGVSWVNQLVEQYVLML